MITFEPILPLILVIVVSNSAALFVCLCLGTLLDWKGAVRTSATSMAAEGTKRRQRQKQKQQQQQHDRFFTFVLTDGNGASYYGGCLERVFASADCQTTTPRSLCVLSRVPAFAAFRDVLVRLHLLTGGDPASTQLSASSSVRSDAAELAHCLVYPR